MFLIGGIVGGSKSAGFSVVCSGPHWLCRVYGSREPTQTDCEKIRVKRIVPVQLSTSVMGRSDGPDVTLHIGSGYPYRSEGVTMMNFDLWRFLTLGPLFLYLKARILSIASGYIESSIRMMSRLIVIKMLIALAVVRGWYLLQLNVNNAFLNGVLDEKVYMKLPLWYMPDLKGGNMVCKLRCLGVKHVDSLMVHSLKLSADEGEPLLDPQEYHQLIGQLLYLTNIMLDIAHTVHFLIQFIYSPRLPYMTALKHLLAYIKQSSGLGFLFPVHSSVHLVSCKSKKQAIVSRSSCKAEYRAMAVTTCKLVWLTSLLSSFHIFIDFIRLYCDNQAAINLTTNQVFHERTKHIEVDCHFLLDKVKTGFLKLFHVRSSDQLTDVFTKTLRAPMHRDFIAKLGLLNILAVSS
ncbi:hypothetical protein F3Y22_tig00110422pilonHSYRG00020 [Hibiscus syriacus]|uniref:Reverse transcriptase Ty1/copia-type domain-containing protein n=1 Tax=Hibiscus syriacus TaxID=106335 RepID=A0A6A3ALN9_HIBSY|nr:hypothetical protein F3Y22_tig00110422pilonHSYRG00020 [Hibiscus syriacus]